MGRRPDIEALRDIALAVRDGEGLPSSQPWVTRSPHQRELGTTLKVTDPVEISVLGHGPVTIMPHSEIVVYGKNSSRLMTIYAAGDVILDVYPRKVTIRSSRW